MEHITARQKCQLGYGDRTASVIDERQEARSVCDPETETVGARRGRQRAVGHQPGDYEQDGRHQDAMLPQLTGIPATVW